MTSASQVAANRRNARGSTGPRSAEGKARTAQNARRHGATGAPPQAQVAIWFQVILGNPDAGLTDVLRSGQKAQLALRLAEAEAQLAAARSALDHHQAERHAERELDQLASLENGHPAAEEEDADDDTFDATALDEEGAEVLQWLDNYFRDLESEDPAITAHVKWLREQEAASQERLLRRYLREAQGRRDRAFRAWIAEPATRRAHACDEEV